MLTFGLALIIEGLFRDWFGAAGQPYVIPESLTGVINLGFMFLPVYRGWVIVASVVICFGTWFVIEKTRIGALLRAATENPTLVQAFGINVPRIVMLTYAAGVALAALAGVMAAPIYQVSPLMGTNIMIVVFAVVVIGGMGSILGAIVAGFGLGLVEGLTKVFYPQASNTAIFVIMAIVLLLRPAGLFGRTTGLQANNFLAEGMHTARNALAATPATSLLALAIVAPFVFYPLFLMKALCFALFTCAFALLAGPRRAAVLRPCGLFRRRLLHHGLRHEGLEPAAGARPRSPARRPARRWAWCSAGSRSAAPASISRW